MAKSIINADGSVDISRLEREIKQDLSLYRKHAAEDGMKKKAIHASADYDEFKNFVSAAELKPTTSRDVSSLFTGGLGSISKSSNAVRRDVNQAGCGIIGGYGGSIQRRKDLTVYLNKPSGIASTKQSSHGTKITANDSKRLAGETAILAKKSSREVHDFAREWEKQCKSPEETIAFLTRIENPNTSESNVQKRLVLPPENTCNEYFSTGIDSDILGSIVEGLHLLLLLPSEQISSNCEQCLENIKVCQSNVLEFSASWLRALVGCGRFGLSASFLNSEQTHKLREVLEVVKTLNEEAPAYLQHYADLLK